MTAVIIYLFFFKWVEKHEGTLSGFLSLFAGLLLIYQAYFVSVLKLEARRLDRPYLGFLGICSIFASLLLQEEDY